MDYGSMENFLMFLHKKNQDLKAKNLTIANFLPIKIYRKKIINKLLNQYAKNKFDVEGRKMYADKTDYLKVKIMDQLGYTTKLMKKFVKKGTAVLDLGANIGFYTCLAADLVGQNGHVYAFEPEPHNFSLLKKNVEINGFTNTILEQKAVADKNYKTKLYLSESSTDHRIYEVNDENRESVEVQVVKLDDYFSNGLENLSFIKTNLQGADIANLKGMKNILKNSSKLVVLFEYSPEMMMEFDSDTESIINDLMSMGFELYHLGRWHSDYPQLSNKNKIRTFRDVTRIGSGSILCMKGCL